VSRPTDVRRATSPETDTKAREGFTLVEIMIAVVILAFGVLGLAGATAYQVRQVTLADLMTERSIAFQQTIDRVQSLPFDQVTSGWDSVGVFYVRWNATLETAQSKIVRIYTLGPGLSGNVQNSQVIDSFDFRVLRR